MKEGHIDAVKNAGVKRPKKSKDDGDARQEKKPSFWNKKMTYVIMIRRQYLFRNDDGYTLYFTVSLLIWSLI